MTSLFGDFLTGCVITLKLFNLHAQFLKSIQLISFLSTSTVLRIPYLKFEILKRCISYFSLKHNLWKIHNESVTASQRLTEIKFLYIFTHVTSRYKHVTKILSTRYTRYTCYIYSKAFS